MFPNLTIRLVLGLAVPCFCDESMKVMLAYRALIRELFELRGGLWYQS